jgi:hypothetical protein
MKKKIAALGFALSFASGSALAQGFNQDNLYAGAGIGLNSVSGLDDAIGIQIFGGYKLNMVNLDPIALAVEVGYMDTGDFEAGGMNVGSASGLWATAVANYPVSPEVNLLGRLGLDFGDDDGLMLGVGAGFRLSPELQLRGEYVIRDNIDSLQANVVYQF